MMKACSNPLLGFSEESWGALAFQAVAVFTLFKMFSEMLSFFLLLKVYMTHQTPSDWLIANVYEAFPVCKPATICLEINNCCFGCCWSIKKKKSNKWTSSHELGSITCLLIWSIVHSFSLYHMLTDTNSRNHWSTGPSSSGRCASTRRWQKWKIKWPTLQPVKCECHLVA